MSARRSYWELLRDPRWQKRRLEIMERDAFRCRQCDDPDNTLNVHHRIYRKGAMPWEYSDEELITLCETCHERETNVRQRLSAGLAKLDADFIDQVVGYVTGLVLLIELSEARPRPGFENVCLEKVGVESAEQATGLGHILGLSGYESMLHLARTDLTKGAVLKSFKLASSRSETHAIESDE